MPPIAGIYIADYYFVSGKEHYKNSVDSSVPGIGVPAFIAWGFSIVVAVATTKDIFILTTIPACDSLLSALISYVILQKLKTPNTLLDSA